MSGTKIEPASKFRLKDLSRCLGARHQLRMESVTSNRSLASASHHLFDFERKFGEPPTKEDLRSEGFIPMFGRTTPVEDGIGHVKSFFGLGIAPSFRLREEVR